MNIDPSLFEKYKNVQVTTYQTLFPYDWNQLKNDRCPICSCKLKFPRTGKIALCISTKHGKPFIIKLDKLLKI